jgi:uncharacterized protein YhfF
MPYPVVNGLRSIEFGTPGESRRALVHHVLHGRKRATAGLLGEYVREGESVEHPGECLAMLDDGTTNDKPHHSATLRVTRCEVVRFADVPDEFALAEAEGDLSAADFRASHRAYWEREGERVDDDTMVVLLWFDLLRHRLRPVRADDADWIFAACQDADIQRWTTVPRPYTHEHAREFVADTPNVRLAMAIIDAASDLPVGVAGINAVKDGVATVGYWVAPWGRRRGAATEALHVLSTIAARLDGVRTVRALIAGTNTASQAVAEHAGFIRADATGDQCPDGDCAVEAVSFERPT